MNKSYNIIKQIIRDLKIKKYSEEKINQYICRVVYSAISIWIRFSTLDEDIMDKSLEKVGVSKIYILNRCMPFLDNMIKLYPEIVNWFYPENSEENPISIIRDRLYRGGELVDVGFNTDLALPTYEECQLENGILLIRGINNFSFEATTGLIYFKSLMKMENQDIDKVLMFYGLGNKSAQETTDEYLKNTIWIKRKNRPTQIFNKYCSRNFSNCWENEYRFKNNDITLYKSDFYDFGFIKELDNDIYISEIKQCLIKEFEVKRFMYGLKSEINNPIVARYKKYNESNLVELNLYNTLPQKEENILLLLGWPIKNINDKFNLLFHLSVWKTIEYILKNLNITLQEVK